MLRWYEVHARELPWRRTRDPYAIWISEVMLQQTRVETVLRYYDRFLARFPTLASLARASEDDVLALWSGLGYYRRARLLHQGAKEALACHAGRVPRDPSARLALPGVGRYTAGAIGSIAFDLPEPIVDGNVARVLARLRAIETPLGTSETIDRLWSEAAVLVEGDRPGALNQALMELGATLCTKARPRCGECPLRAGCRARIDDRVELLPVPKARRVPRPGDLVALVAHEGERVLLVRSSEPLFGGLWGVPTLAGRGTAALRELMRQLAISARAFPARPCARLEHVLSHRRLAVRVFACDLRSFDRARARLCAPPELATRFGISTLTRKILAAASPFRRRERELTPSPAR